MSSNESVSLQTEKMIFFNSNRNFLLFFYHLCYISKSIFGEFCADKFSIVGTCDASEACCIQNGMCSPCQEVRGVWQGLLGKCVFEPEGQARTDSASLVLGLLTTGRCVPVQSADGTTTVDSSLIEFRNFTGRMVTTVQPSTATGSGTGLSATVDQAAGPADFNLEFSFSVSSAGLVDIVVDTWEGQRVLLGAFSIAVDQVACALNSATLCRRGLLLRLALGTSRPPSAIPSAGSAVQDWETAFVYMTAFRTASYAPLPVADQAFDPASCLHRIRPGETLDSLAASYRLLWQDLFALNPSILDPSRVRPGDVVAVGRHHTVRGPCLPGCMRQVDQAGGAVGDVSCMVGGQCLTCDWASAPGMCGETLYAVASRYGSSWQRLLDMNPSLAARCSALTSAGVPAGAACVLRPGDRVCVVPFLRGVVCGQEYRRYPVTDSRGLGWQDLGRFFTCNPVWSTQALANKCCHLPRCRCCTADGADGGSPTAGRCGAALPVTACVRDPGAASCTDDCACVAGLVPLLSTDPATGAVETSCLLATQCRACVDPAQAPPRCSLCARAF